MKQEFTHQKLAWV